MKIPLESRAHVIFTYTLVPNEKNNLCIKKIYYEGIKVKVPHEYDVRDAAEMLACSTDLKETINQSGFRSFHVFTDKKEEALTLRYDEVYDDARRLELQVKASMYVESLNEEWTPF